MPRTRMRVSFEDALRIMGHEDRRRLLVALMERPPEARLSVPEDMEREGTPLDAVRVELYHTHLPLMDEMGVIDWDQETNTITRGPGFVEIRPVVELLDRHRDELPYGWV